MGLLFKNHAFTTIHPCTCGLRLAASGHHCDTVIATIACVCDSRFAHHNTIITIGHLSSHGNILVTRDTKNVSTIGSWSESSMVCYDSTMEENRKFTKGATSNKLEPNLTKKLKPKMLVSTCILDFVHLHFINVRLLQYYRKRYALCWWS